MILSDSAIHAGIESGDIVIDPFEPAHVGPNSCDLRLGSDITVYSGPTLDARRENMTGTWQIPDDGIVLEPGRLYLAHTVERAGSTKYVPMVEGRSSMGRLGLWVHVSAGFGDVGFVNQWTLELAVVQPLRIYAGMRVCQVFFHTVEGVVASPYKGKYATDAGAVGSRAHLDFKNT